MQLRLLGKQPGDITCMSKLQPEAASALVSSYSCSTALCANMHCQLGLMLSESKGAESKGVVLHRGPAKHEDAASSLAGGS